ncbi:hypothetical protein BDQ17DRAFT_1434286 [Cyathus striatus]|nr:hypothetical protein BDQ17DRAFT_1434286 [Cyathus striatus]
MPKEHEEDSRMNIKLQAYRARTSHIQTRLLTTLDTLDTLQNSYDVERHTMQKELRRLEIQLEECASSVKAVQAEKDDLQDAVLRLTYLAVEAQGGEGSWPRSQMRLSSFADSLPLRQHKQSYSDEELLSFAASIIKSLRIERDAERDAHGRTRDEYETRILTLEARIARMEAELENCVQEHTALDPVATSPVHTKALVRYPDDPITDDEAIEMLHATVARNKALEMEIKTLFSRLENARSGYTEAGVNTFPPAYQPEAHGESNGSPPERPPPNTAAVPLEQDIPNPRPTSAPDMSVSTTANVTDRSLDGPTIQPSSPHEPENTQASFEDTISAPFSSFKQITTADSKIELRELDNQIKELAAQVDAFKQERDVLSRVILSEKQLDEQCPVSIEIPERLNAVEMECLRLRHSEENLRSEVEALQRSAQAREQHLVEEIQALKEQISALTVQTKKSPSGPEDLLNDQDGELSMELVTPLQPTSLLRDNSHSPPLSPAHDGPLSPNKHPPSISLPPSPIIYPERSSEPTGIHRPSPTTSPLETREPPYDPSDASDANIERLAMELSVAQRRVQEGEDALNDLQTILEEFQSADG